MGLVWRREEGELAGQESTRQGVQTPATVRAVPADLRGAVGVGKDCRTALLP